MTDTQQSSSPSGNTTSENEDHKDIVASLENMFKHRFSEADEEFMKVMSVPLPPPPTVQNWYTRPKRTFDWTRDRDNRGRGGHRHSGRPHYAGSRDNYRDQYHDKRPHHGGHYDRHHRPDNRHHPYQGGRDQRHGQYRGNDQRHHGHNRGNWSQNRPSYH